METSIIIKQNPWWKLGKEFANFDKDIQTLDKSYVSFLRHDIEFTKGNIYLILGPRQVGKTVWIKQHIQRLVEKSKEQSGIIFKEAGKPDRLIQTEQARGICYLSCDTLNGRSRKELRAAIDFMVDGAQFAQTIYLFLDEINYIKGWREALKELADSGMANRMVIIATGSNPALIRKESETLPGRHLLEYFLKPITFREFARQVIPRLLSPATHRPIDAGLRASLEGLAVSLTNNHASLEDFDALIETANTVLPFKKELDFLFTLYLLTGGFPRVINDYMANRFQNAEQKEYIANELYRDFTNAVLGDLQKFGYQDYIIKQVLGTIIRKIGGRYSYSSLAQAAENLTKPTLIGYLELLKNSFILNPLFAYDFSRQRAKYNGDKKIYFSDQFILASVQSFLAGQDGFSGSQELAQSDNKIGYLIESVVAQHLMTSNELPIMRQPDTFLWFHYNSRELDFVYKTRQGDYLGIETAYQFAPRPADVARIAQIKKYLMLTRDEFDRFRKDPAICMMPVSLFLGIIDRSERNL